MTTNEALRKTLQPVPSTDDKHLARLRSVQFGGLTAQEAGIHLYIAQSSYWDREEASILLRKGFSIFVGDEFLCKCKYAAGFCRQERLTASSKEERWDKTIMYRGDVPDSVLDKVELINQLRVHSHSRDYMHHITTHELFEDLEYLVVSTQPLPIATFTIPKVTDPFLLVFRRKRTDRNRPMIEVSERGRIKQIRQTVGKYGFLIVGMWNMNEEVFA